MLERPGVAIGLADSADSEKHSASKAGRVDAARGRNAKKNETTLARLSISTAGGLV